LLQPWLFCITQDSIKKDKAGFSAPLEMAGLGAGSEVHA
jgi:hypothetical protein